MKEDTMSVKDVCVRNVACVHADDSVTNAAKLMREQHLGSLVVVTESKAGRRVPVGMITDRDIAVGVVALDQAPGKTTVEAAMSANLVSVRDTETVGRAVMLMRAQGVRRLPVTDAEGALIGLVAADDILEVLASEVSGLAGIASQAGQRERRVRLAALYA
jgi:CBS domain-containing protein